MCRWSRRLVFLPSEIGFPTCFVAPACPVQAKGGLMGPLSTGLELVCSMQGLGMGLKHLFLGSLDLAAVPNASLPALRTTLPRGSGKARGRTAATGRCGTGRLHPEKPQPSSSPISHSPRINLPAPSQLLRVPQRCRRGNGTFRYRRAVVGGHGLSLAWRRSRDTADIAGVARQDSLGKGE